MNLRANIASLLILMAISSGCGKVENEVAQIKNKTKAYQEAFNQHDAKAIAALFADDGIYTNPESENPIQGKAEIEKAFEAHFKEVGDAKIEIKPNSLIFPSHNEAVESGTFVIKNTGQTPVEGAYKTYFEKNNGVWLIGEIRDIDIAAAPNQYEHLKDLEWLIGKWVDADPDVEIHSSFEWDKFKNFIYEKFSIVTEGTLELEGTQVIGWDPIEKKIRSWIFDSDGGFGQATWIKKDKSWIFETAQTLADGSRASSINILTPIDANSYTWESTGREVGGRILPDIDPITIVKTKS